MRILIIEDEQRTADQIVRLIKQYDSNYSVVGIIDSVKKGLDWFTNKAEDPDILIADIQLGDGNIFDLFNQINLELPVVFITAYNQFAIKAFKVNSIDYLLKPISFIDLKVALDKYIKTRDAYLRTNFKDFKRILVPEKKASKRRFLIKAGNGYKFIFTDEIAYFMTEEGIVFSVLFKGGRSMIENNITELCQLLDPDEFFQLNRNTIANIKAIYKISDYFNRRVILKLSPDNHEVIVSRERVQEFKEWMNK